MGLLTWIIFGALVGWIASKIMNTDARQGAIMNIIVGIVGALIGGFLMNFFGGAGVTGFNVYSFLVALLGSVVLLWLYKVIATGGNHHASQF